MQQTSWNFFPLSLSLSSIQNTSVSAWSHTGCRASCLQASSLQPRPLPGPTPLGWPAHCPCRLTSVEPVFFNFRIVLILQKSCGGVAEFLHVPHPVSYYRDCGAFVLINEPILAHYSEYLVQIIFIFP